MNKISISYKRHLAKTISYRLISTTIGFVVMWLSTGSIKIGAAFGIAELLYKPFQYYLHERIWYKWIKFGVIKDSINEKKTKSILSESKGDNRTQTKEFDKEQPSTQPNLPLKKSEKKTLNYNSNR